ncbi:MAG TPA: phosphoribosylanthranilate isomerase [Rhizomicrobium sp.]|nr:phosphoribosylanthranilate isomerase [Rhizomicrobium sp.]
MAVQVKICGITTAEAADAALVAGADYCGLVFFPGSPRCVAPEQARALAARLRGRTRIVALLADAGDDAIAAAIAAASPDMLQLHGRETPDRVAGIRAQFATPVMKAIAVAEAADLSGVAAHERVADMLMFDARAPRGAGRPGGHGAAFDWQLLRGRSFTRPWLLAGGLDAENVARAVQACGAPGVDASSGVESAPGVKSPELIGAFVAAARRAHLSGAPA